MKTGFWVLRVVVLVVGPEFWLCAHALNPANTIIRLETMDSHVLLLSVDALDMSFLLLLNRTHVVVLPGQLEIP